MSVFGVRNIMADAYKTLPVLPRIWPETWSKPYNQNTFAFLIIVACSPPFVSPLLVTRLTSHYVPERLAWTFPTNIFQRTLWREKNITSGPFGMNRIFIVPACILKSVFPIQLGRGKGASQQFAGLSPTSQRQFIRFEAKQPDPTLHSG